jgi:hypothetical protein
MAVPVGKVRYDRAADKRRCAAAWRGRRPRNGTTCSYFVWHSMRGQPQFPHTSSSPFLGRVPKVNVGIESVEFKGKGRGERKAEPSERERAEPLGGNGHCREARPTLDRGQLSAVLLSDLLREPRRGRRSQLRTAKPSRSRGPNERLPGRPEIGERLPAVLPGTVLRCWADRSCACSGAAT